MGARQTENIPFYAKETSRPINGSSALKSKPQKTTVLANETLCTRIPCQKLRQVNSMGRVLIARLAQDFGQTIMYQ